jgi:cysteinyl-tRNA synthetase
VSDPVQNAEEDSLWSEFKAAIDDDLNTPVALSVLQKTTSKNVIEKMDEVLGLDIKNLSLLLRQFPDHVLELKDERDRARREKNWARSDELRQEIERLGFILEDKGEGSLIRKTLSQLAREVEK